MKNLFTIILLICIGVILVLGCTDTSKPSTKTDQTSSSEDNKADPEEKPVEITAKDLTKAYEENELAADGKYRDKTLAVSGKISSIAETLGNVTVSLEGHNGIVTVMCSFEEDQKANVMKLKKGQNVTLIGKGDGSTGGLYSGLKACKVK